MLRCRPSYMLHQYSTQVAQFDISVAFYTADSLDRERADVDVQAIHARQSRHARAGTAMVYVLAT